MKPENQIFEGRELIQLQVGVYQLLFAFEGDVALSVESTVHFEVEAHNGEWLPENPQSAASLTAFVGKKVERVEEGSGNDLRLIFLEGGTLAVSGKAAYGEAYQITSPSGVYVV